MDQTLGKSARSNGDGSSSGGAGSGGSQGGKKSDDDEDLVAAIMGGKNARRCGSQRLTDKPLRAQFAEARGNGIGLLQRHLRRRQGISVDVQLPTLPAVPLAIPAVPPIPPAEQSLTTSGTVGDASPAIIPTTPALPDVTATGPPTSSIITAINTNTQLEGSSNQIVLSSTPPPSPAGVGPSFSAPLPTASIIFSSANDEESTTSSAMAARTTVTSFVSSSMFPLRNETSASTSWHYSTTTIDETVWVYAFPTVRPATTHHTSEHPATTHHTSEHPAATHHTNEHHRNSTTSSTRSTSSKTTKTSSRPSASNVILSTSSATSGVGGVGTTQPSSTSTSLPPNSQAPKSGGGSSSLTPKLVGGLLGGLAGLALLLALILMWVKRRKKRLAIQARVDAGYGGPLEIARGGGGGMGEKPSITPLAAAAGFFRPAKQSRPSESIASDAGEERGFYKVSGRKLPPAIGGPRPDFRSSRSITGSSVYPEDDIGGGPATPVSSVGTGPTRYSSYSPMSPVASAAGSSPISIGIAAAPGGPSVPVGGVAAPPAESRIQEEPSEGEPPSERMETPSSIPSSIPRATASPTSEVGVPRHQLGGTAGRDGLGRSLPSRDGSRASRFTEDIV